MSWLARSAAATGVLGGAMAVRRAVTTAARSRWPDDKRQPGRPDRWHVVTINKTPAEVMPAGRIPQQLLELGDQVEVETRPAPGDRGTELRARLRPSAAQRDGQLTLDGKRPDQAIRLALRQAKQLAETGEILGPSRPATTRRTLLNRPLEYATRHGREEGRI